MRLIVNKNYSIFLFVLLFSVFCLTGVYAKATTPGAVMDQNRKANNGVFNPIEFAAFQGYKGDGSFVESPAYAGDVAGYVIGVVPAVVISEPFRLIYRFSDTGDVVGEYTLYTTTKSFGCVFGGPSFLLKGVFYDAPVWLFSSIFGSSQPASKVVSSPQSIQEMPKKEVVPVPPVKQKKVETPEITSISAKPSALKPQSLISEKAEKTSAQQEQPTKITPGQSPQAGTAETTNEDETSWNSPPPLPDWIKKETK
jgi:hypothetical protein